MNKPQIIKSSIKNIRCGKGVKIMDPCNLYDCFLDDNVFVGPFVEVQSDVTIGKKYKNSITQLYLFSCYYW